jgi:hypothetical protein
MQYGINLLLRLKNSLIYSNEWSIKTIQTKTAKKNEGVTVFLNVGNGFVLSEPNYSVKNYNS